MAQRTHKVDARARRVNDSSTSCQRLYQALDPQPENFASHADTLSVNLTPRLFAKLAEQTANERRPKEQTTGFSRAPQSRPGHAAAAG